MTRGSGLGSGFWAVSGNYFWTLSYRRFPETALNQLPAPKTHYLGTRTAPPTVRLRLDLQIEKRPPALRSSPALYRDRRRSFGSLAVIRRVRIA